MNINRTNLALVVLGGAVGFLIACAVMKSNNLTVAAPSKFQDGGRAVMETPKDAVR